MITVRQTFVLFCCLVCVTRGTSSTWISECGENEVYTDCGSACVETCDFKPEACTLQCVSGCFCKGPDYVRKDGSPNSPCIKRTQCKPKDTIIVPSCGPNEVFKTCGSACVETCTSKPKICTLQCVSGCFCKGPDYVRKDGSPNSPCIKRDQCKPKDDIVVPSCGPNEVFKTCGSACVETCKSKPTICTRQCVRGCFCKEPGYVRRDNSANSPCIKREDCGRWDDVIKPRCGPNEEYQECGSACPVTCDFWRYPLPKRPAFCLAVCVPGCFCKQDYYRSDNGKCVPREQCCGRFERFTDCGTACPETCTSKPLGCTKNCVAGCFCLSPNYVRRDNSTNSPCIRRSQCPGCKY